MAALSSLTQRMGDAAQAGEWDSVIDLESERDPQLQRLSVAMAETGYNRSIYELWRQTITSIIDSDKAVAKLAALQQDRIARGASDLVDSRKAIDTYLDNMAP